MDNFSLYQALDTAPDSGKVLCACGLNLWGGLSGSHKVGAGSTDHSQTALPRGVSYTTALVAACQSVWVPSLLHWRLLLQSSQAAEPLAH